MMAASPSSRVLFLSPQPRLSPKEWVPVLVGLAVICCESTPFMGGDHTGRWLMQIWPRTFAHAAPTAFGWVHHLLRKLGHFTGYGTLGLFMRRAWHHSVRIYLKIVGSRLMFAASALSVFFTFLVGCLDEWHQSMLPNRSSAFHDVLIDTSGALMFNAIFWIIRARHRGTLRPSLSALRTQ
jgi:VanZ family protein